MVILFLGCDSLVRTPGVTEDRQGANVDHTGFKAGDCKNCHESDRPLALDDLKHGDGNDCGTCHYYSKTQKWNALLDYAHKGEKTCGQCHEPKRPAKDHVKSMDCVQCHTNPDWSKTGTFDHVPHPKECLVCHKDKQPSPTHYGGADCMGCHKYNKWNEKNSSYNHFTGTDACTKCHADDRPALPHDQTQDCKSCHSFSDWKTTSYTHAAGLKECAESCHARPTEVYSRAYPKQGPPEGYDAADTDYDGYGHLYGKNCGECHISPGDGVNTWGFDHSKPKLNFCLPCHYNQGEQKHGTGNNSYDFTKFGNCVNCHKNYDKNVTRSWSTD